MSKLPISYKAQTFPTTCSKCTNCFVLSEYDSSNRYYCTLDGEARPISGSILMEESFNFDVDYPEEADDLSKEEWEALAKKEEDKFKVRFDAWEKWAKDHEVSEQGICDNFKTKEISNE